MLGKYLKQVYRWSPHLAVPTALNKNFSLINQFLNKERKSANSTEDIDESLISKAVLRHANQKKAGSELQTTSENVTTEDTNLTAEERLNQLQLNLDNELDLPYKLYGSTAQAPEKVIFENKEIIG
jgi:hypothetical protein